MYTKLPVRKGDWCAEKFKNEKTLDENNVKDKIPFMQIYIYIYVCVCVCVCVEMDERIVTTHSKNKELQDNSVKCNDAKRSCREDSFIFFLKEKEEQFPPVE